MARRIENRTQRRLSVTIIGEGITEQYYAFISLILYGKNRKISAHNEQIFRFKSFHTG